MTHDAGQDRARHETAARGIAAARDAYERSAAAVEVTLNALTASTSRTAADLHVVASGTHDTLLHLSDGGLVAAQAMRERLREAGEQAFGAFAAVSARNRAGLRDLALRSLAAADTNIRAAFDALETMARAGSAQDALAAQAAFLREQTQRSLRQAIDLQRATADLLHAALPGADSVRTS